MNNSLLEDSGGKNPDWDMGTGEGERPKAGIVAAPVKATEAQTPKPMPSVFRHTVTPQPAETHTNALPELPPTVPQAGKPENFPKGFPAEFDERFPDNLAACYGMLRAVDALPTHMVTKHGLVEQPKLVKEQLRRRVLIGEHIQKLSGNRQVIPQILADDHAAFQRAQHERPANLKARMDVLQKFVTTPLPGISGGYEPDSENTRDNLGLMPKLRLLGNDRVQKWLLLARHLACQAEVFSIQNWDLLQPGEYVACLERELRSCHDPVRARELQAKISVSQQSGERTEAEFSWRRNNPTGITRAQADQKWEPAIKALRATFDLCRTLLAEWRMEAILAESEFFAGCTMEWRQTEVSKRFADLDSELKRINVTKQSFAWFGVEDYAETDSEAD
jgi:hypothetical protein